MNDLHALFLAAGRGDREAFAQWMGRVERPVRASLARYARAADVEGVLQETLLRMWIFARERGGELQGENASLRFAIGMARNIARSEARRHGRLVFLPPEELPDEGTMPEPPVSPSLARLIRECFETLARRPREALAERLHQGAGRADREVAAGLGMTLNTFLQNIVRARRQMRTCLAQKGIAVEEMPS